MGSGLVWQTDRALLDDLVFRLAQQKDEDWELGGDCFEFYKTKGLVELYDRFWSSRTDFRPRNILELGIWDGGSVVFWFEYFHPEKHVAIDISKRGDSAYFTRYIRSRGLEGRIRTLWRTDQGNAEALRGIVQNEFRGPLDLVIDDASHIYELTKTSFETLFPLLRSGGLYIIEDWAWAYWKNFSAPDHWGPTELSHLVHELVAVVGSSTIIASLGIFSGFAVIEKAENPKEHRPFKLEDHVYRHPRRRADGILKKFKNRFRRTSCILHRTLRDRSFE